jgi:Zn-dependent M28 family amino/carboxypeptidase
VKKQGTRIQRDVEVVNVVAVLPGTTQPEKRLIVSGHYDSVNMVRRAGAPEATGNGNDPPLDDVTDFEKSIEAPAPGATDDATGTALVLELARVMSQYKFEKTIVFVTFAAEELGLVGSTLYADKAKAQNQQIEAVFNNDIVGNDVAGNGHAENGLVHVYSEDPDDSPSRELARYIRDAAQRYVPGFQAELVFRNDRFGRSGDHTPFNLDGFTAVRFTTAAENLESQHTANDTLEKASPIYNANVARVNAAGLASLALAPSAPVTMREIATGANKGRKTPNMGRGKSHYDAVLHWTDPQPAADLAGYAIVVRATTAPYWDHQIFVGKVNEFTLPGVNIDEVVLGVKAIDVDGHESMVAPYVNGPAAPRKPIELQP